MSRFGSFLARDFLAVDARIFPLKSYGILRASTCQPNALDHALLRGQKKAPAHGRESGLAADGPRRAFKIGQASGQRRQLRLKALPPYNP